MLTKKQLAILRKEIVLNSLFTDDYNNSLFIKPDDVQAFFDGFIEYIADEINSDDLNIIFKNCTIKNIYAYYTGFFSAVNDPLAQRDYILTKPLCNYGGIGVLYYDDDIIKYRYDFKTSYNNDISKIKKRRLHYDYNRDDYYFIDGSQRYYLNDFVGVY